MRIMCVMGIPLVILLFYFRLLDKQREEDREQLYSGESEQKYRGYLIYLIVSEVLLLVLGGRLVWGYQEQSVLFQCKRMGCIVLLFAAAAIDFKKQIIPNQLILSGIGVRVVLLATEVIFERDTIVLTLCSELLGTVGIFLVCMIFLLIMKNSIGMGDIKLFMVMGLYLGLYSMMNAIMSSLILAFICTVGLLLTRRKGKKDSVPFAPAVLAGTYLSVFLTGI